MKQIRKRLEHILQRQLLIDKSLINEQARLEKNLSLNGSEFNLLLYYFERDLDMKIPDGQLSLNQNVGELAFSLYQIKRLNDRLNRS